MPSESAAVQSAEHDEHEHIPQHHGHWGLAALTALGIVFGDIGTSPLYAMQLALKAAGHELPTTGDVLGVTSLIIWALAIVVALKYVVIVLRADNEGEGGILALLSLVSASRYTGRRMPPLVLLGIFGAALLYGDGVITPAISVLSAMEGIKVAAPSFERLVIPLTLLILVALFLIQRRGTAEIGRWFGPVMCFWFVGMGAMGLSGILTAPQILMAFDPRQGVSFLLNDPLIAFAVFGTVFLALTGGEALYADMGHVGSAAIRRAWFFLVWPALMLNYLGQGGLLLADPAAVDNPFYKLAPESIVLWLVALATAATVIASQALISGVFSIARQAITMRLSPRMLVVPTSSRAFGQIYISFVNWGLMAATLVVVVMFKTSDALGAAYGIAVSATMLITTILLYRVERDLWHWPRAVALPTTLFFAAIDATFLAANALKITDGGWLPLAIGGFVAFTMVGWRLGNIEVQNQLAQASMPFEDFMKQLPGMLVARLPGTGVFVTRLADTASPMLLHHVEHNRVLHEKVVLLTVVPTRRPRVPSNRRLEITEVAPNMWRVVVKIGFMQRPDIPVAIRGCTKMGIGLDRDNIHYYIAHESLVRKTKDSALEAPLWIVFNIMHRMGLRASDYFHLPPRRVIEVGFRLEI